MKDKKIKILPDFLSFSCEAIDIILKVITNNKGKENKWQNQWEEIKPLIDQAKEKLGGVDNQLERVGLYGEQLEFKLEIFEGIYDKFKEIYKNYKEEPKKWWETFKSLTKLLLKAINIIVGSLVFISALGLEPFKEFKEFLELKLEQDDLSQKFFDFKF